MNTLKLFPVLLLLCGFNASAEFREIPAPKPQSAGEERKEFTFAVLPVYGAEETTTRFAPLADLLTRKIGVKVRLISLTSFEDHVERVRSGLVDFSYQNPVVYAACMDKADAFVSVLQKGQESFAGVILVRADSAFNSVLDLKGKTIAVTSKLSAGGYLSQFLHCQAEGLDITRECSIYTVSGNKHENVVLDVFEKRADAGFVRSQSVDVISERIDSKALKVLASGEEMPNWVMSAGQHVPKVITQKLKEILLSSGADAPELAAAGISSFVAAESGDFIHIRQALDASK